MNSLSGDDYWFASDRKAFDFQEEVSKTDQDLNVLIKNPPPKVVSRQDSISEKAQQIYVPISSILTQECLDKLLDNTPPNKLKKTPENSVSHIITQILLNQPYSLTEYRSLANKTELLDAAIDGADGNAILTVVLFLGKTLKKSIFYKILSTRPIAIRHYVIYLENKLNYSELTDVLMISGHSDKTEMKLFKTIVQNISNRQLAKDNLKKIQSLYINHYMSGSAKQKDSQIVKKYLDLLEWQIAVQSDEKVRDVLGESVNNSLAICCKHYWRVNEESMYSPQKLAKQQNINDKQFHSIFLTVKATEKNWDQIKQLFIKQNWIGNKKINSTLDIEMIILKLTAKEAPMDIIEMFICLVEDSQRSLYLAIKNKCHQHVINYYLSQKDRNSLIKYKSKIAPHSEDYFYLESILNNKNQKWKT